MRTSQVLSCGLSDNLSISIEDKFSEDSEINRSESPVIIPNLSKRAKIEQSI